MFLLVSFWGDFVGIIEASPRAALPPLEAVLLVSHQLVFLLPICTHVVPVCISLQRYQAAKLVSYDCCCHNSAPAVQNLILLV